MAASFMTDQPSAHPPVSRGLLVANFLAVYLIWGSTYLAIRVAVETLPPFLMAAARFTIAGGSFFVVLWLRGAVMPSALQWRNSIVSGVLLLLGGNGLVVWAEQTLPSGRAALIVATTPAWFALLEWLRPGGTKPSWQTVIGIAVGFVGVSLLIDPAVGGNGAGSWWVSGLAVVSATASWAAGSLYSKYTDKPASPWMNAATQMLGGGAALLVASLIAREPGRVQWSHVSAPSVWSFAYLIVFGSCVAYSAYVWLLKHTTPATLSTYAYVNPVIAVFLGWLLVNEPITGRTILAAGVILTGVIIITLPGGILEVLLPWFRLRRSSSTISSADVLSERS
jgi:drug/metabolite transporter (DMT)-like permease